MEVWLVVVLTFDAMRESMSGFSFDFTLERIS